MATQVKSPNSDYSVAWTPNIGTDNYGTINEYPPPSDTGYNSTNGADGTMDKFGFPAFNIPTGSTSISLSMRLRQKISNAIYTARGRFIITVNGTDYNIDPGDVLTTSFADYDESWATNPGGSAWTAEDINGTGSKPLQYIAYDMKRSSGSLGTVYVSQMFVTVTYTAPTGVTVSVGLQSGSKTLFSVSENTDQTLTQNLIAKTGSLLASSPETDQLLSQKLIAGTQGIFPLTINSDQVLGMNLLAGDKTLFPTTLATDQVVTQNLLGFLATIFSSSPATDQVIVINLATSTGFPFDITVNIYADVTINLGQVSALIRTLEISANTDQILSQNLLESLCTILGATTLITGRTDQALLYQFIIGGISHYDYLTGSEANQFRSPGLGGSRQAKKESSSKATDFKQGLM